MVDKTKMQALLAMLSALIYEELQGQRFWTFWSTERSLSPFAGEGANRRITLLHAAGIQEDLFFSSCD